MTLSNLVSNDYLKNSPSLKGKTWESLPDMGESMWLPLALDKETCQAVNKKLVGTDGIPALPISTWNAHCFGVENQYSVIVGDASYVESSTSIPQSISDAYADKGLAFGPSALPVGIPPTNSGYWNTKPTLTPWVPVVSNNFSPVSLSYDLFNELFSTTSITLTGVDASKVNRLIMNCPYNSEYGKMSFAQLGFSAISSNSVHVITENEGSYINSGPCYYTGVLTNALTIQYKDGTEANYPVTLTFYGSKRG